MRPRLIYGSRFLPSVLLLLFIWPVSGCRKAGSRDGVALSYTVPVVTFLHAGSGENGMKNAIADFPTLEVFDRTGQLVYRSHDAGQSVALVKSLPGALNSLTQLPNQPDLPQVVGSLAGLAEADKGLLLNSRQPTVISYSLEGCEACSVQEEALGPETVRNLSAHGLNSLMIRVSRPR
jgi:hypothetical protein